MKVKLEAKKEERLTSMTAATSTPSLRENLFPLPFPFPFWAQPTRASAVR